MKRTVLAIAVGLIAATAAPAYADEDAPDGASEGTPVTVPIVVDTPDDPPVGARGYGKGL